MIKKSSITISYFSEEVEIKQQGFNNFENQLKKHYKSIVKKIKPKDFDKSNVLNIEIFIDLYLSTELTKQSRRNYSKFNSLIKPFISAYRDLKLINTDVDIEELIISFNDCSLIINKVCKDSIYNQLESIIEKLVENFNKFKFERRDNPFEIFIPVYDSDSNLNKNENLDSLLSDFDILPSCSEKESLYFKYWGIYYELDDQCMVYDFNENSLKLGIIYSH